MRIRSISRVNIGTPLALPLGELSPQVTERVLHPHLPSPASLVHISQRESQGGALKNGELPESGDNALYLPHLGASLGNEGMGFPPPISGFS